MASANITLRNSYTGATRIIPLGYSWTVLFFGFFVPMFRGSWGRAAILFILGLCTYGFSNIVISFFFNRWEVSSALKDGFRPYLTCEGDRINMHTYIKAETLRQYGIE